MTFDEIVSRPRRFRCRGKELELRSEATYLDTICLWAEDKSGWTHFSRSDVSELTPLSFEGRGIAIGDEVQYDKVWYQVYGFFWLERKWKILSVRNNNFDNSCWFFEQGDITAHRTPNDVPPRTVEQVIASLPDADKAVVMKALNK